MSLCVERRNFDRRNSVYELHGHLPWIAAHFAILDVSLNAATAWIHTDLDGLTAIRTGYACRCVRSSIAQGEFVVEVFVGHTIDSSAFPQNCARLSGAVPFP